MPIIEKITSIDKKFAWSFLGVILAVAFGVFGIYTSFFYERKPDLTYEIISNTTVFDVKENISKLDVLFNGTNIRQSGQSLRVITLRLVNNGQQDILKTFYDENDPLGFVLLNGEVVEQPTLTNVSNDYLGKNLKLTLVDAKKVTFSSVILEAGQSFGIKLLVLSPENTVPDVLPVGKIASVASARITRPYLDKRDDRAWVNRTFGGNFLTQLVRLGLYGVSFVLLVALGLWLFTTLSERLTKIKRNRILSGYATFLRGTNPEGTLRDVDQFVIDLLRQEVAQSRFAFSRPGGMYDLLSGADPYWHSKVPEWRMPSKLGELLVEKGWAKRKKFSFEVDSGFSETVEQTYNYLKSQGFFETAALELLEGERQQIKKLRTEVEKNMPNFAD